MGVVLLRNQVGIEVNEKICKKRENFMRKEEVAL